MRGAVGTPTFYYRGKPAEDELRRDPAMGRGLSTVVEVGAQSAVRISPYRTRHYLEGIHGEVERDPVEGYVGFVVSDDFKTVWIELGTGEPLPTPPFQPLRRGLESIGVRLESIRSARHGRSRITAHGEAPA